MNIKKISMLLTGSACALCLISQDGMGSGKYAKYAEKFALSNKYEKVVILPKETFEQQNKNTLGDQTQNTEEFVLPKDTEGLNILLKKGSLSQAEIDSLKTGNVIDTLYKTSEEKEELIKGLLNDENALSNLKSLLSQQLVDQVQFKEALTQASTKDMLVAILKEAKLDFLQSAERLLADQIKAFNITESDLKTLIYAHSKDFLVNLIKSVNPSYDELSPYHQGAQDAREAFRNGTGPEFVFKMYSLNVMKDLYKQGQELERNDPDIRLGVIYDNYNRNRQKSINISFLESKPLLSLLQKQLNVLTVYNFIDAFLTMKFALNDYITNNNVNNLHPSSKSCLQGLFTQFQEKGPRALVDFTKNDKITFQDFKYPSGFNRELLETPLFSNLYQLKLLKEAPDFHQYIGKINDIVFNKKFLVYFQPKSPGSFAGSLSKEKFFETINSPEYNTPYNKEFRDIVQDIVQDKELLKILQNPYIHKKVPQNQGSANMSPNNPHSYIEVLLQDQNFINQCQNSEIQNIFRNEALSSLLVAIGRFFQSLHNSINDEEAFYCEAREDYKFDSHHT